jgi:DNA mismatch endonuclease (patch repair protein)
MSGDLRDPLKSFTARSKDRLTKERRSWNMSHIRGKNTAPEMRVRSALHRLGFRFRIHERKLPGKPDVVLAKYKTVVFVHGCFWHQHRGCIDCSRPRSNANYWTQKLHGNVVRGRRHKAALKRLGWRVITVWECQTTDIKTLAGRLAKEIPNPALSQQQGRD